MVKLEGYDSKSTAADNSSRTILKLEAGQRIRNVEVTGCIEGVSDYGAYTLIQLEAEDGELLSLMLGGNVFGRNGVKALTIGEPGSRIINPAIIGKKVWIGKSQPVASKNKKSYFNFQFGFENA
ncbi:hypothetical protein [Bacteroides sp.]|uniref:hypothetical protein n=1 Tax=Bacteroides sp. TaxID=29523 RepID=UPI002619AA51|nr:hypothetical protein [Bacteroides sp.]MDD3040544.1 hypothetical protein [Bacteroides sp.]